MLPEVVPDRPSLWRMLYWASGLDILVAMIRTFGNLDYGPPDHR